MKLLNIAGVAALAAGMALGQSGPAHPGRLTGQGATMQRLGADLNLTDAQKQQARTIFSASRGGRGVAITERLAAAVLWRASVPCRSSSD